jgi:hypothetical protein
MYCRTSILITCIFFALFSSSRTHISAVSISPHLRRGLSRAALRFAKSESNPCRYQVPSGTHIHFDDNRQQTVLKFPNGTSTWIAPCHVFDDWSESDLYVSKGQSNDANRQTVSHNASTRLSTTGSDVLPDAWSAWAEYVSTYFPVTKMEATFNVPPLPTDAGLVAFFPALQNLHDEPHPSKNGIIQPVMQRGTWASGGVSDKWAIASWNVQMDGNTLFTRLIDTEPGNIIHGVMTMTSKDVWEITTTDVTTNQSVTLKSTQQYDELWAFVAMETYNIQSCASLPAGLVTFKNIQLTATGTYYPTWTQLVPCQCCNIQVIISDPQTIAISPGVGEQL